MGIPRNLGATTGPARSPAAASVSVLAAAGARRLAAKAGAHGPLMRSPRRKGLTLIVIGTIVAVLGVVGMLYIARAMSLCNSGLGALAQAANHNTARYCEQDSDFHAVSVMALVVGLIMAVGGIVRRIVSARTLAAAHSAAPVGPAGPWQVPSANWPPPPGGPQARL